MKDIAVIFDMDGVITHNNDYHQKAWLEFGKKVGVYLTDEDFKTKIFGKTNEQIIQALSPNQYSAEELERLSEEKEALFREIYRPDARPSEGFIEFVESCKEAGIPMGVCTNAPKTNLDFVMDVLNIRHYFKHTIYALMVEKPKPEPDIYLKMMELLGKEPQNCLVFEDSLTGAKAGKRAGAKVGGITSSYTAEELMATGNVDFTFNLFSELSAEDVKRVLGS